MAESGVEWCELRRAMSVAGGGWQGLALGLFRRVRVELTESVEGLAEDELNWRPSSDGNSTAWLVWHIARGQDRNLSEVIGKPQLWLAEGWADRFDRPADPSDTGFGHSTEEAHAFLSPGGPLLLSYLDSVHERAENYLSSAPAEDLHRIAPSPTLGTADTVEVRIQGQIADSFAHLGQIGTLRGLMPKSHEPADSR
ncbi:DinB family protein [Streptomyces sp. NPDC101132]|uniref:DinB family protein n=1 Tax=Streptomyces sp. NPDC101132 TaxID=3366110 RepID=UPI003817DA70